MPSPEPRLSGAATRPWIFRSSARLAGSQYVDGHKPWCADAWSEQPTGIAGITCVNYAIRQWPDQEPYFDIGSAMVTMDPRRDWYWGTGAYSSGDAVSGQGIATHELGHAGGLRHETTGSACTTDTSDATMCATFTKASSYGWGGGA